MSKTLKIKNYVFKFQFKVVLLFFRFFSWCYVLSSQFQSHMDTIGSSLKLDEVMRNKISNGQYDLIFMTAENEFETIINSNDPEWEPKFKWMANQFMNCLIIDKNKLIIKIWRKKITKNHFENFEIKSIHKTANSQ